MPNNFVVVKNAVGIKKLVPFQSGALFEDAFRKASREFGLNSEDHELRIGYDKIELNRTIEGSNIPDATILDIVPKLAESSEIDDCKTIVELILLDEGHQIGEVRKLTRLDIKLSDLVEELVPEWMRFERDSICLSYMGTSYSGEQLRSIVLSDLCGNQSRLSFNCSRNHPLISNRNTLCSISDQLDEERVSIPTSSVIESNDTKMESVSSADCSGIELKGRKGRLYRQSGETSWSATKHNRSVYEELLEPGSSDIRATVHFPDQLVVEADFQPMETIRDVMEFINGYLVDDAKNYYLYTIRPKLIADPNKRLQDMRSSPTWHLWFNGKKRKEVFQKKVTDSLITRAFSCISNKGEQSKRRLEKCNSCHGSAESYFWSPSISNNKL